MINKNLKNIFSSLSILLYLVIFGILTSCGGEGGDFRAIQKQSLEDFIYNGELIEYKKIDNPDNNLKNRIYSMPLNWDIVSEISYNTLIYKNTSLPMMNVLILPKNKNKSLIIYNHGHDGLPTSDQTFAIDFINLALLNGFSIIIDSMPLTGLNKPDDSQSYYMKVKGSNENFEINKFLLQWPYNHQIYQAINGAGNFMHFFVDGSLSSVNFYALEGRLKYFTINRAPDIKFDKVHYVGLSGGGFSGLISCALYQYQTCTLIAGFLPFKYKISDLKSWGDIEQWADSFFNKFSYEELMLLANINSKKFSLMYNSNDDCCFSNPEALDFKKSNPELDIVIIESNKHGFDSERVFNIIQKNN